MNAKKLVSGCMAAFLFIGSVTGMAVQAKAGRKPAYSNQNAGALMNQKPAAVQTDYYEVETIGNKKNRLTFI